jgi:tetratricopeptide (TPR) repeat protein
MFGYGDVWVRSLLCFLALAAAALPARAAAERPQEIRSWRHEMLSLGRYDTLATAWEEYAKAHPKDARALVEWGDALRYSGERAKRDQAPEKYKRAFEMDPKSAPVVEAYVRTALITDHEKADWARARRLLADAVAAEPDYADTYYMLWMAHLHERDAAGADEALRTLVRLGDINRPLLDFGINMLAGAPQNAIILTNGDNDTYPPLAAQAVLGMRKDVAIVNLSLLNTRWYIRHWRDAGVPIPLDDAAVDALEYSEAASISQQVQTILHDIMQSGGSTRPLMYAITVPDVNKKIAAPRRIAGLLELIGPGQAKAPAEADLDLDTTRRLLDTVYRFDSMTDPMIDWKREGTVARLGHNYVSLFTRVAQALSASGRARDAGSYYARAIAILSFHGAHERASELVKLWEKDDPESPLLPDAKKAMKP